MARVVAVPPGSLNLAVGVVVALAAGWVTYCHGTEVVGEVSQYYVQRCLVGHI